MEKVIIARMGLEGYGVTIYGRRTDGVWSFWQEGTSMDLDEIDGEVWRGWSSDPVPEFLAALPDKWWQMSPTEVHPEFATQLRREYEQCVGASRGQRGQFQRERWAELFSGGGPHAEPPTGLG
jgi:hypothetical protein